MTFTFVRPRPIIWGPLMKTILHALLICLSQHKAYQSSEIFSKIGASNCAYDFFSSIVAVRKIVSAITHSYFRENFGRLVCFLLWETYQQCVKNCFHKIRSKHRPGSSESGGYWRTEVREYERHRAHGVYRAGMRISAWHGFNAMQKKTGLCPFLLLTINFIGLFEKRDVMIFVDRNAHWI